MPFQHRDKLLAALQNKSICESDRELVIEALDMYGLWTNRLEQISGSDSDSVSEAVRDLNSYKDALEIDLFAAKGSDMFKRQQGQMKLDNSILEEFLERLFARFDWIENLENGSRKSLLSMSFDATGVSIKTKDHDHVLGRMLHDYVSSSALEFPRAEVVVPLVATEIKKNFDKTMFEAAAATSIQMKTGCPQSKYYVLAEYLDMADAECSRAHTRIDGVFLLRHGRRLPHGKRQNLADLIQYRRDHPICTELMQAYVEGVRAAIQTSPDRHVALQRGWF